MHGGFAFPLFAGRAINGVIELFSERVVEPDPDLLQLVTALGSQIGLFIERRRIEKELELAKENAEAASAAKDRFLATLSHELRTPLNPVLLWADGILNQPGVDPELEHGLRMVCRNVELEARLIDDLLDLTRIARGKLQLRLEQTDAHELIEHAIEIVRADANASSRLSSPSFRPSTVAAAPLDVANASNPSPISMRADAASHGFGMTKVPAPS